MDWDMYKELIYAKLSDASHNMKYFEKEYKNAKAVYDAIEKQLQEYEKLIGGKTNDRTTLG